MDYPVPILSISDGHVGPGLEEGEPLVSGSPGFSTGVGCPAKPSWSSVVAQGEPRSNFILDFFSPLPPSNGGSILIRPPSEVLIQGNNLWNFFLLKIKLY